MGVMRLMRLMSKMIFSSPSSPILTGLFMLPVLFHDMRQSKSARLRAV